ncbi:MAG: hypothetical protein JWQ37_2950 [Blastococcus sp.]|nr:hypothetical protein [Blastococcus sp.]
MALLVVAIPMALWTDGSGREVRWSQLGHSAELAALPVFVYSAINLVFYGFGEELGWRGFLQPQLEGRWSVVTAANVLSVIWAAWHLRCSASRPARAIPLIGFVGFYFSIWGASWIFAWLLRFVYGSLLVVAVFHAWFDVVTNCPLGISAFPTAMGVAITLVGLLILRVLLRAGDKRPTEQRSPTA